MLVAYRPIVCELRCYFLCLHVIHRSYSMDSPYKFFIQTKKKYSNYVQPGSLCYILNSIYDCQFKHRTKPIKFRVTGMGSSTDEEVMTSDMSLLTTKEAELLYALEGDCSRLLWFQEKNVLKSAVGLTIDTPVTVIGHELQLPGIIRYIGTFREIKYRHPISGTFFGIELQVNYLLLLREAFHANTLSGFCIK